MISYFCKIVKFSIPYKTLHVLPIAYGANYIPKANWFTVCRIKALQTEPYTQEEADRAAGMGSYKAPKKVHVETQSTKEEMDTEITENENTWTSNYIWYWTICDTCSGLFIVLTLNNKLMFRIWKGFIEGFHMIGWLLHIKWVILLQLIRTELF